MDEQKELRQEIEQVVELACMGRPLTEQQQALLRWAAGVSEPSRKKEWEKMQEPLFI